MLTAETLNALTQKLGHTFRDTAPLLTALTHSSYVHETSSHAHPANERLEFLGDAVLNLVVAEALYSRHPQLSEGQLSKLRSFAVNEETLALIARHLEVASFLWLGKGEARAVASKDAILADALEALLGALWLDGGLEAVRRAWSRWQSELNVDLLDPRHLDEFDAKSRLQEFCMKAWQELPAYESHEARVAEGLGFQVTLHVHGRPLLSTRNVSKKKAELWLAKTCLQNQLHLVTG